MSEQHITIKTTSFLENDLSTSIYSNFTAVTEMQNIKVWSQNPSLRGVALTSMSKVLSNCSVNHLMDYGVIWMDICIEIVLMDYENESVQLLAADNFDKILHFFCQVPALARDVNSEHISIILRQILQSKLIVAVPILNCLNSVLNCFPGPCGEFKGKLVKFLLPVISSPFFVVQEKAIACWCCIPTLGGGGVEGKDHSLQWERQFNETFQIFDKICSVLFDDTSSGHLKDLAGFPLNSLALPFPPIPNTEPDYSFQLYQRLTLTCRCLCAMLKSSPFKGLIKIQINHLMSCLQTCCLTNLSASSDCKVLQSHLNLIHRYCLDLIMCLIRNCPHYISQTSEALRHIFLALLDTWKEPSGVHMQVNNYFSTRSHIYRASALWVETCIWGCNFLCEDIFDQKWLGHWMQDVSPVYENEETSQPEISNGKRKRTCLVTHTPVLFHKSHSELRAAALRIMRLSLYAHGTRIKAAVYKSAQHTVLRLVFDSMRNRDSAYSKCDLSRRELYHLLLAFSLCPHPACSSSNCFALSFFQHFAVTEKNLSIRSLCMEACSALRLIIRPHTFNINKISSSSINAKETAELLQTPSNCFQDDVISGPTMIDAETSTEDFNLLTSDKHLLATKVSVIEENKCLDLHVQDMDPTIEEDKLSVASDPVDTFKDVDVVKELRSKGDLLKSTAKQTDGTSCASDRFESFCNSERVKEVVADVEQSKSRDYIFESSAEPKNSISGQETNGASLTAMMADFVNASPDSSSS